MGAPFYWNRLNMNKKRSCSKHAYYLDYQNRRADHLAALRNIIDWNVVDKRLNQG